MGGLQAINSWKAEGGERTGKSAGIALSVISAIVEEDLEAPACFGGVEEQVDVLERHIRQPQMDMNDGRRTNVFAVQER